MTRALPFVALALLACGDAKPKAADEPAGPPDRLVGIEPDRWACERVMTIAQIGELLGGPARQIDSALGTPPGVAKPCTYAVTQAAGVESWTVDFDCRPHALTIADKMFEQYRQQNQDLMAAIADASVAELTDDAGVVHTLAAATDVEVGKRAFDSGQALIFVDDDAPCYGRVAGPDPVRRLAVATFAAQQLHPANAPMQPRPE